MRDAIQIRPATADDIAALRAIDTVAAHDARRVELLRQWVAAGHCHLLLVDAVPAAYGVLHHHFFDSGFIEMVMVGERFRRHGLGGALLRHLLAICARPRLFSPTCRCAPCWRATASSTAAGSTTSTRAIQSG